MGRGNPRSLRDRSRRRKPQAGSVDGNISDLPECILSHILSFLPLKNAMATSILSQRWKFLWTMTNNLDFLINHDEIDQNVRFVNHVLLLHPPGYLKRLSLKWKTGCIPYYVNTWISAAVLRDVHELFVHVDISKLPRSMFRSESLRSLELTCEICVPNDIDVSLPSLESLSLILVSFDSEETLCKILNGCPVLKSLYIQIGIIKTMEYCRLDIDNSIEFKCIISSDSLRRLEVCSYDFRFVVAPNLSVQLDAPFLEYIKLDKISSICIHQRLVFLVEAIIEFVSLEPVFKSQSYYNSVAKAFRSFDCVKTLTLSPEVIEALSRAIIEPKYKFNSLTRLEVPRVCNWSSLGKFLTLADCLEVLALNTDDTESYPFGKAKNHIGSKSELAPRCFLNSLKTVSINDISGFDDEVASVGYILKHGSVLEDVHLHSYVYDVEEQNKLVKEISKFPKKSPVCKVEFHDK